LPLERNGRKTLTTVQGIPSKFDHKKILKVVKKEFGRLHPNRTTGTRPVETSANIISACNGTIISDTESKGMGEVIQLQGDQRTKIKEFLVSKSEQLCFIFKQSHLANTRQTDEGLGLDEKTIKVHGF